MKIKSIAVLPSAKGYLAVTKDDLFVPEYIVLAVIENGKAESIVPLAISDLCTLSYLFSSQTDYELENENQAIQNNAVSSMLISKVTLHTAAAYICKEVPYMQDVEEAKNDLIAMAEKANIEYDKRIKDISSVKDCQQIVSGTFRKL